jgi:PAS domain S-box-containing protein
MSERRTHASGNHGNHLVSPSSGPALDVSIEVALEQSATARLAAIVESSSDAMIGKTLRGVITSWNSGAERMYGYTAEAIVGQNVSVLIPRERPDELSRMLAHVAGGERIEHFDTTRRRADGTIFDVSVSISPIRDQAGVIVGASTVTRDLTDRRRAEAAIRDLQERLDRARRTRTLEQPLGAIRSVHQGLASHLGTREVEVLCLMATGISNKALAQRLHLSLNTVRNHVQSVLYKLHAHSKLEAVAIAVRDGIIDRDPSTPPVGRI